jgi:hypothetical protein
MYNPVLNKGLKTEIKGFLDEGKNVLLTGPTGIGKSAIIREFLNQHKYYSLEYNLRNGLSKGLLNGFRERIEKICETVIKDGSKGALFFDDLSSMNPDEADFFCSMIKERDISGFKLDENWLIVSSAVSGLGIDGCTFDVLKNEKKLISCFKIIKVEPASLYEGWIGWAKLKKLHPFVISFLEKNKEYFFYPPLTYSDNKAESKNYCVPGMWEDVSKNLQKLQSMGMNIIYIIDSIGPVNMGKDGFSAFKEYVKSVI